MLLSSATRQHFHSLLDARTLTDPDLSPPAIIFLSLEKEPVTITRAGFLRHIQQEAAALHGLGIRPGDLLIIAHTQNLDSIFAFWGALLCGAVPSMFPTLTEKLDANLYLQSMAALLRHSQARAVLTTDEFAPQLAPTVPTAVYGASALSAARADDHPLFQPQQEAIAFLQHSSGTTGLQKGVALSHQAVLNQLASYSDALQLQPDDVIVSWLPLYHDMGLIAGFLLPLVQGIPLVLMSPFEWVRQPAMLLRALDEYRGTLCWLPNFAYKHCVRSIRNADTAHLQLAHVRAFINCSEPVHQESHQAFYERFQPNGVRWEQLQVSYAMAENTFAVTQTPLGQPPQVDVVERAALEEAQLARPPQGEAAARQLVSCGPPIAGTALQIVDAQGQPLPERHVGEIAIQSDYMLKGYHQRPDLNAKLLHDGWFHTGDMGYMAAGELYVIGRKKDLIINAGKNLYPADLEAIVNRVPGVHPGRVVVFGVEDERSGTELIAVLAETKLRDEAQQRDIQRQIRQQIVQSAGVTATYVQLVPPRWLLKTSSGKIAREANRRKWLAAQERKGTG